MKMWCFGMIGVGALFDGVCLDGMCFLAFCEGLGTGRGHGSLVSGGMDVCYRFLGFTKCGKSSRR